MAQFSPSSLQRRPGFGGTQARPTAAGKPPAAAERGAAGGDSAGASLGVGRTSKPIKSALGREMAYTLKHGWDYLTRMPKVEPDPLLLLRAARSCWLLDDMDAMCVYYREAAAQLKEVVEISGRRTGTAPEYWRLALGALWMVSTRSAEGKERQNDQAALRSLGYLVVDTAARMASEAGQPLDRMALEMARLRGSWYAGDAEFPRVLTQVEQRAAAMDANNRGLWQGERDYFFLNAVKTITRERPERMSVPLTQMDEYLTGQMVRPPTVPDLVDEDLIALEAAAFKAGMPRMSLRAAQRAGSRKGEVG